MIKVGDYIKFNNKIDRVEEIVPTPNDKYMIYFENIDHGVLFDGLYESMIVDYKQLYEQQKLRADDLQKQLDASERMRKRHRDNGFYLESEILKEKLRADRAEKRWSELKETVEKAETSWAVEELLYGKSSTSKEYRNYLKALLKMMHDLEENGE